MLFTRWWISFTEELLELAYRGGSQCNGCIRTPFTEPAAWLKAEVLERPTAAPAAALGVAIFGKLKG
jgi:hypothetical protein